MNSWFNKKRSKRFFFGSILVMILSVFIFYPFLPQQIVSDSFNLMARGANSPRQTLLIVQLVFLSIYTLVGYLTADVFTRVMPDGINIPNKEYWLHPSRIKTTVDRASAIGYWIFSFSNVLIGVVFIRIYLEQITGTEITTAFFPVLISLYLLVLAVFLIRVNRIFKKQSAYKS